MVGARVLEKLASWTFKDTRSENSPAGKAHFEVERKFRLNNDEFAKIPGQLEAKGFVASGLVEMTDYFLPVAKEGDMLRVRFESEGAHKKSTFLTQKTWHQIDGQRERLETEQSLSRLVGYLLLIVGYLAKGGKKLSSFSKRRFQFAGVLGNCQTTVCLDQVEHLEEYSGCYLEVEILVPASGSVTSARDQIAQFTTELFRETREPVQLSYMEMLKRVLNK